MPLGYDYIIKCLMIMSMIGISIKVFFGNERSPEGDYGSADSTIWGFGLVALCLLTLMFVSFSIQSKLSEATQKSVSREFEYENKKDKVIHFGKFLMEFMSTSMPSLITIGILLWVITLNVTFYKRINQGNVTDEYFSLTSGSSFLFTFQIICLFLYLNEYIKNKLNGKDTDENSTLNRIQFAVYFIAIINLMITGIMTIILYLFSADG